MSLVSMMLNSMIWLCLAISHFCVFIFYSFLVCSSIGCCILGIVWDFVFCFAMCFRIVGMLVLIFWVCLWFRLFLFFPFFSPLVMYIMMAYLFIYSLVNVLYVCTVCFCFCFCVVCVNCVVYDDNNILLCCICYGNCVFLF
jgi:hypothetical protein